VERALLARRSSRRRNVDMDCYVSPRPDPVPRADSNDSKQRFQVVLGILRARNAVEATRRDEGVESTTSSSRSSRLLTYLDSINALPLKTTWP
jgi:hypothetical protein